MVSDEVVSFCCVGPSTSNPIEIRLSASSAVSVGRLPAHRKPRRDARCQVHVLDSREPFVLNLPPKKADHLYHLLSWPAPLVEGHAVRVVLVLRSDALRLPLLLISRLHSLALYSYIVIWSLRPFGACVSASGTPRCCA
jgi:hypothetical protein